MSGASKKTHKRPPFVLRWAFIWGRWAAQHPAVAMTVYALELLIAPALWWFAFGFGFVAAVVLLAVEIGTWMGIFLWARRMRRRRGLPPLPPLWRRQSPPLN